MKGEDIKAGSNFILSNNKGRIAPVVAAKVVMGLISITTLAATTGAILPLLFDRMKLDPALMSSPFITTVTDIAGVFIYLSTAKWLLSASFG